MPGPNDRPIPDAVHRQILGEQLFPKVAVLQPEIGGLITGILVTELSLPELYDVLECESERKRQVADTIPRVHAEILAKEVAKEGNVCSHTPSGALAEK